MPSKNKLILFTIFILCVTAIISIIYTKNHSQTHPLSKITRDEYLLENFNTMDEWTLQSSENTAVNLNNVITNDTSSMKLTAANSPAVMTNKTSFNLGDYTGGEISFYVENKENIEYVSFYFATDSELKGPFGYVVFEEYQLTNGWNTLPFSINQIESTNGLTSDSDINNMQILLQPKNGEASVYFDTIKMIKADKANAIFIMDDGWKSQYSTGFKMLNANNIPGNIAVVPSLVDTENYMSKTQLNKLYRHGWDFLNHTYSHQDLSTLTLSEQRKEITDGKNWLNDNGFTRASNSLVYPYGDYNEDTFKVLNEIGSPFGRTVNHGLETHFDKENYQARVINLTAEFSVDYIKREIDTAIATGNTILLLNHKFGDENDPMYYSKEKFETIVKYIKSQVNAGKIQTPTISEWLKIQ